GACGVGKSSLIRILREKLPVTGFVVRDFDETQAPGWGDDPWLNAAIKEWLGEGIHQAEMGKELVCCGPSFVDAARLAKFPERERLDVRRLLLDAGPETIRNRLLIRYQDRKLLEQLMVPLDEFIEQNMNYCLYLKNIYKENGFSRIDTDTVSLDAVAEKVTDWILTRN